MDIHEYQAKELLAGFGIKIPEGALAYSPEQAAYQARHIGGESWVVKAQIHSGGRGKVGGVRLCDNEDQVYEAADQLFGSRLKTRQSGSRGKVVYRVYVEGAVSFRREMYIGLVLDRKSERIMVVASAHGGMEIEEISAEKADSIVRCIVEPAVGMQAFQAREIAFSLGIDAVNLSQATDIILAAYRAFEELDATMVEINPLVEADDGFLYALDAKMTFDDNALFRHPEIAELRDKSQEDSRQTQAVDRGLKYIALDGNIGCLVNGAGLGLATLDMVVKAGGKLANFIDIGGGASPERVAKAIRLIRADASVSVLLVNVFAGINRCDWIAEGIVQVLTEESVDIPVVVRIAGNNLPEGRRILSRSGLPIVRANTLEEAARRAVTASQKRKPRRSKT
jgi:succinyl-CoA synthetase beta subunit/malate-CoA ligase subunit beta